MSSTTHVFHVSGVPMRPCDLDVKDGRRLLPHAVYPWFREVSLANALAGHGTDLPFSCGGGTLISMSDDTGATASAVGAALPPDSEAFDRSENAAGRWLYADKPLEHGDPDALNFGAYADALALVMDWKETSTPLTIAINGPWGSGKTSLAKMTEARLPIGSDWDAPHVICWFDAWANDDAPHLGAAFAAAVAAAVNKQRHWWIRLAMPLPSVMLSPEQRWRRRLYYGLFTLALAATAVFWPTGGGLLTPLLHPGTAISGLGHATAAIRLAWPLLLVAVILLAQQLAPGVQGVARWIDNPGSEAARGSMVSANRQLGQLIRQALRGKRRLMIFVDNLERCRPPRAVDVCEVVSQLIGHPDVVTVMIGDMDTIALSAEIKYAKLESISYRNSRALAPRAAAGTTSSETPGAYGRAYLEKLIQIQLRLPPPLLRDLREMLVPVVGERSSLPLATGEPSRGFRARIMEEIARNVAQQRVAVAGTAAVAASSAVALISARYAVPAGVLAALLVQPLFDSREERRKLRSRTALDEAVSSEVKPTETALRPDAVEKLTQQVSKTGEKEIRRRMRQRIISNNDLRTQLDRAVLRVLPLSPRGAKRMFNHAHLLLDIGVERGIFATQPGLRPGQLAAWVALTERWPSVAAAITTDTTLIGRLEEAVRQASPDYGPKQITKMERELNIAGLDDSLLDFLNHTESLVPVVRVLVNFYPDADESVLDGEA
jgi:hypothetical protein